MDRLLGGGSTGEGRQASAIPARAGGIVEVFAELVPCSNAQAATSSWAWCPWLDFWPWRPCQSLSPGNNRSLTGATHFVLWLTEGGCARLTADGELVSPAMRRTEQIQRTIVRMRRLSILMHMALSVNDVLMTGCARYSSACLARRRQQTWQSDACHKTTQDDDGGQRERRVWHENNAK